MTWDEIKTLEQGTTLTNKPALKTNEEEHIIQVEFVCYDKSHDQAVIRLPGVNRFSTFDEYQAKYWERT